jgi:hypothetical protein
MTSLDDLETLRITPFKQLQTGTLFFLYAIVPTVSLFAFSYLSSSLSTRPS